MTTFDRMVAVFNSVFEDEIPDKEISLESNLRDDLGVTSISMLYVAMAIEEEFGIQFNNEDFSQITTLGDVLACIERKQK